MCWENYMPLARAAMYALDIDIYLAPTWDNSDAWVPTMQHIAKEGRVFVIGVNFCMNASVVPVDLPKRDDVYGGAEDWLARGNSVIVDPDGTIVAGPLIGEAGILYADLDLSRIPTSRFQFDLNGHYARPDIFTLHVDTSVRETVSFGSPPPTV